MIRKIQLLAAVLSLLSVAHGQGTFQNLDFENGSFIPIPGHADAVEFSLAMPGWSGYVGTNQVNWVLYNTLSLSEAGIAIQGPDDPSPNLFHGRFFVVLQYGNDAYTSQGMVGSALAQTGTIPIGTQSIRLLSNNPYVLLFDLSFGGSTIPLFNVGISANGRPIWGGDISSFAGQTGELRFAGAGYLDYIQFSTQQVPEPSALSLIGVGALLVCTRLRRGN